LKGLGVFFLLLFFFSLRERLANAKPLKPRHKGTVCGDLSYLSLSLSYLSLIYLEEESPPYLLSTDTRPTTCAHAPGERKQWLRSGGGGDDHSPSRMAACTTSTTWLPSRPRGAASAGTWAEDSYGSSLLGSAWLVGPVLLYSGEGLGVRRRRIINSRFLLSGPPTSNDIHQIFTAQVCILPSHKGARLGHSAVPSPPPPLLPPP
jgi:hypothetical protein